MENRPKDEPVEATTSRTESREAPYEKPRLTSYGSLARLTRSNPGTLIDGRGTNRMTCL
jgi:hypothetical protein